mgnify:CR=1 FL=1
MAKSSNQLPPDEELPTVGQRKTFYFNDNGQPAYQVYDLVAEDFLNPQPGDEFFHGETHDRAVRILSSMLHHHYRYSPTASVHIRRKVVWPGTALDQPMPDIVVVNNLVDPFRLRPVLDIAAEQAALGVEGEVSVRAIFEVTSPALATIDAEAKAVLYARAGVPEYWIIDSGLRPDNDQVHFAISGYTLQGDTYQAIAPDAQQRLESKACRLWLAVAPDAQSIILGDLRTGKTLPMPAEEDDPSISAQAEASRRAQSIAAQLKL